MDQEGGRRVGTFADMVEGGDGCYEVGGRGGGPGFVVIGAVGGGERGGRGGTDTVEEEWQAVAFFEEGEDELGPRVAGPHPAEVAAVGAVGGYGVVCYLDRGC